MTLFAPALFGQRANVIVLVIDGLRPDVIRPDIMPTLARMKQEGAWFANAHSVFPTVTRVNSASISTGTIPAIHGIVSNTMWVDAVSPKPFDTSNYKNLVKLAEVSGGRALPVPTLAELLEQNGIRFAALSSGSTGSAFLLNPQKAGVLISPGLEGIDPQIVAKFGTEKADAGIPSLLWTEKVLRGYVLPEIKPGVVINWMTEPDGAQHRYGVGSPEALAALKTTDEQIALLLDQVGKATNLIVTADHGFAAQPDPVDLEGALKPVASDVIVASNGASALIYAKNHNTSVIQKAVEQLQRTGDVDAIFTAATNPNLTAGAREAVAVRRGPGAGCSEGKEQGWVPGTFSLELIGQCSPSRGADVIVTFRWSSEKNEFGFPGTQKVASNDKRTGVRGRSGHGGLNAWMVHTPLLFWGPDFKHRAQFEAPVANFDIAPTILALEGINAPDSMRGRAITEAFAKSKTKEPQRRVRTIRATAGDYCAEIQVSSAANHDYIDQGQRCR